MDQEIVKPAGFKVSPRLLILGGLIILALVTGVLYWRFGYKFISASKTSSKTVDPEVIIDTFVKKTFSENKYKKIIEYNNLALKEENQDRKYDYYRVLFTEIRKQYWIDRDAKKLAILRDIKILVAKLPNFQDLEFIMPI